MNSKVYVEMSEATYGGLLEAAGRNEFGSVEELLSAVASAKIFLVDGVVTKVLHRRPDAASRPPDEEPGN